MSHSTITAALTTEFQSQWASRTEIEYANTPKSHTVLPYVRFSTAFLKTENACVGSNVKKYQGLITVQCFTATNIAYGTATALADQAILDMENKYIGTVFTNGGYVEDIGKDPDDSDLYVVNAVIPFMGVS